MSYAGRTPEQRERAWQKANEETKDGGPRDRAVLVSKKKPAVLALARAGVGPCSIAVRLNIPHAIVTHWLSGKTKRDVRRTQRYAEEAVW